MNHSVYFKLITSENFDLLKTMFYEIFPEEPHYDLKDFRDAVDNTHHYGLLHYYYIYRREDDVCVGFIGIYSEKGSITECWIGWFGILPQYRRKGYARAALNCLMASAQGEYDFEVMRVYTDNVINASAVSLYESEGFVQDSCYTYNFITLVKPLKSGAKIYPWVGIPVGFESEPPPGVEE